MSIRILRILLTFIFITFYSSVFSQEIIKKTISNETVIDSLRRKGVIFNDNQKKKEIVLSTSQAIKFLQERYHPQFWNDIGDPLRQAFGQLIFEAAHPPVDSLRKTLTNYPFDSLNIPWDKFYIWEPLRIRVPYTSRTVYNRSFDSAGKADINSIGGKRDSLNIKPTGISGIVSELKDTTIMVVIDTLNEVTSPRHGFPFKYYNYPFQGDSIKAAVRSLISFLDERDSTVVYLTGVGKSVIPVWMNSKSGEVKRFWLKTNFRIRSQYGLLILQKTHLVFIWNKG